MTKTVLENYVKKQKPKLIVYRKYINCFVNLLFHKSFVSEGFLSKLKDLLPNDKSLQHSCLKIWNPLAPLKVKYVRANQAPFMNRVFHELQKAIIISSKL